MIYGLYKLLGIIGMVVGAALGFKVARSFSWFGTFRGIMGQFIIFMVVGALIGGTVLSAPLYLLFKDHIRQQIEIENGEGEDYYESDEDGEYYGEGDGDYEE